MRKKLPDRKEKKREEYYLPDCEFVEKSLFGCSQLIFDLVNACKADLFPFNLIQNWKKAHNVQ